jgi:hypothetical protein
METQTGQLSNSRKGVFAAIGAIVFGFLIIQSDWKSLISQPDFLHVIQKSNVTNVTDEMHSNTIDSATDSLILQNESLLFSQVTNTSHENTTIIPIILNGNETDKNKTEVLIETRIETLSNDTEQNMDFNSSSFLERYMGENATIITMNELGIHSSKRFQSRLAPSDTRYLSDVMTLKEQLNSNNHIHSSCKTQSVHRYYDTCYGLGTSLSRLNTIMAKHMLRQTRLTEVDNITCGWFERDHTQTCNTMFGDCYFPSVSSGRNKYQAGQCYRTRWFQRIHSQSAYITAHYSWLMGISPDSPKTDMENSQNVTATETKITPAMNTTSRSCIALQIRRGDACIGRGCFDYVHYWNACKFFIDQYSSLFTEIVVVTDADDFPLEYFQSLGLTITYVNEVNRTKYNVNHLRNFSIAVWTPENRDLGNATSELISEVAVASQCQALVGTFSSGVSRWIMHNMIGRQGRIPLFYSLEGCLNNLFQRNDYSDDVCEPPIF